MLQLLQCVQQSDAALLEEADRLEREGMFELQLDEADSTWQLDLMLLREDLAKLQGLAGQAAHAMGVLQQEACPRASLNECAFAMQHV